jgi:hypothetical protein
MHPESDAKPLDARLAADKYFKRSAVIVLGHSVQQTQWMAGENGQGLLH